MSDQCLNIEESLKIQNPQDFFEKIIKGSEDLRSVEGILAGKDPLGWLVVDCPNFFFMPSLCYNQFFFTWDNGNWNCPKYWKCKNFNILDLYYFNSFPRKKSPPL